MKIGLVQINNTFSGQFYFPYSVGLMQAHLQAYSKRAASLLFGVPIYARQDIDDVAAQLVDCDVVMMSLYVWNERISLSIAKKLKLQNKDIKIIVGGPQVPNNARVFLSTNPFIDIACHGEGESIIVDLIDSDLSLDTKGISFLLNGNFRHNLRPPRIQDLNVIPSPYLNGVFDSIMVQNPDQKWIACWETNRGCPFSCTFCDWGSSTQSKIYQFDMLRLQQEIDWFSSKHIDFVFCCDANFGILPRDLDIAHYVASVKKSTGFPKALSVQNTKNATERAYAVQKALSDSGLNKGVTISMQSLDPTTLENIKRSNISINSYQELQRRFTIDKVGTYTDIILALPGETLESCIKGINAVITNGQHNRIQFNNLSILPNAEMGNPEYQHKYGLEIVETNIVNFHGKIAAVNEILEKQKLVVGTNSLPKADWVKLRSYCWLVALLYFDKTLQIPLSILHRVGNIPFQELFARFSSCDRSKYRTIAMLLEFFDYKALDIQNGGVEYCHKKEYLDIYWPSDEFMLIKLITDGLFDEFYREASEILLSFAASETRDIVEEAIKLNKAIFNLPFKKDDVVVHARYNIWETYLNILEGRSVNIKKTRKSYLVKKSEAYKGNWDDYYREIIWWGNKEGRYICTNLESVCNTEH